MNFLKKENAKKFLIPTLVILTVFLTVTTAYLKRKVITVVDNGHSAKIITYKSNVSDALKSANIILGPKDKIQPSLGAKIYNKDTIYIKRAFNVEVSVEGKNKSILTAEDNVASMLKAEGIVLNSEDEISPGMDTKLTQGMVINIVKVENKTLTETVPVKYNTVVETKSGIPNTEREVIRNGQDGVESITTNVVYENGKEVSRNVVNQSIIKQPVNMLVVQGTYPSAPVSRGGGLLPYGRILKVRATAYWAVDGVGRTYTSTGRLAVRNPDGYSTIAVDPRVIPYGTKLFIQGYGFAVAADSGSAIEGNRIDVFFDTAAQARSWAVKYVNVYIMK